MIQTAKASCVAKHHTMKEYGGVEVNLRNLELSNR